MIKSANKDDIYKKFNGVAEVFHRDDKVWIRCAKTIRYMKKIPKKHW